VKRWQSVAVILVSYIFFYLISWVVYGQDEAIIFDESGSDISAIQINHAFLYVAVYPPSGYVQPKRL
jgi:hypothetical protein